MSRLLDEPSVTAGSVDLNEIYFVRVLDIPGNGMFLDSQGNSIIDNWLTTGSGGFDLDAVGAVHVIPEPGAVAALLGIAAFSLALVRRGRFLRRRD